MEVFCTSIPPSKNKFRAKVLREPELAPPQFSDDFSVSKVGKPTGDLEMGRKHIWDGDASTTSDCEQEYSNNDSQEKDGELSIVSPELSRITLTEGTEGRSILLHTRRSSWTKGGSFDMTPELGSSSAPVSKEPEISQSYHQHSHSITSPEVVSMASRVGDSDQFTFGDRLKAENRQQ